MGKLIVTQLKLEDQIELLPQIRIITNNKIYHCYSVEFAWLKWGIAFDWGH